MARSRILLEFALVFAAVLLAACRAVVDTAVNKDGSGELRTSIVFSAEEKKNFDGNPDNAGKSICDGLKNDASPPAALVERVQGDETYCTTVHPFNSLKQLRDYYDAMVHVKVLELSIGPLGSFAFRIQVDLTSSNGNEAVPNEWRLTVPGRLGDNNADRIESNTLIWNIQPGEIRTLQAESALGPRPLIQMLVGGMILLLGILFAVWLAKRASKRKARVIFYSDNNLSAHSINCTISKGWQRWHSFSPGLSQVPHGPGSTRLRREFESPKPSIAARFPQAAAIPMGQWHAPSTGSRIKETASPNKKIYTS